MRFVPALVVGVLLNAALFLFHFLLRGQIRVWSDQGVALSGVQTLLVRVGVSIGAYWYVIGPAILGCCLLMALILGPRRGAAAEGSHA